MTVDPVAFNNAEYMRAYRKRRSNDAAYQAKAREDSRKRQARWRATRYATPESRAAAALAARIRYREKHPFIEGSLQRAYASRPRLTPEEKSLRKQDYERAPWHVFKVRLRRHGLTLDQYHSLLEKQDFLCALCTRQDRMDKYAGNISYDNSHLVVDHDHATTRVRSLLCGGCNFALGYLEDSLVLAQRAVLYLQEHNSRREQA